MATAEAEAFDEKSLDLSAPRINLSAKSTSSTLSTGLATFKNVSGGYVSVSVWFQNGNAGNSNATIPPGQTWQIWVQTGDTYSWAPGNNGVPTGAPRYWINYGLNNVG
ncbi:hypothetical protein ACXIUS_22190 [Bosea thiooxidans]|nr:hypothetical protein [Bosea sp. (in: a-proteobacteria)]